MRAAQSRKLSLPSAEGVASITGRGIQANMNGKMGRVGNEELFSEAAIEVPQSLLTTMRQLESSVKTTMIISLDQAVVGLIAVADVIRAEASLILAQLKSLGIERSIMLTDDNERTAAHISQLAALSEARANLMPEEKLTIIRDLVKEHEMVAMIGDGVNDAPALANATVGIAVGGAGTDVALETADIALMGDDLSKLPFAVGLGRATRAIIQQNLAISLGVIALLIIASVTGFVGIGIAILFHEGSTLVVVANALRLLGYNNNSNPA